MSPSSPAALLLHNFRLFDGRQPRLQDGLFLTVRSSRIEALGPAGEAPERAGYTCVDLQGLTLLPGLIDAHVQMSVPFIRRVNVRSVLEMPRQLQNNLRWCLASGVTTVRDMMGMPGTIQRLRREVNAGKLPGPRIFCANSYLTCPGGCPEMAPYFNPLQKWFVGGQIAERLTSAAQVRASVRSMVEQGADWIKTGHASRSFFAGRTAPLPCLSDECYAALVEEARRLNRPVAFHQTYLESFRKGLALGVQTLEHVPGDGLISEQEADEVARKGSALVATLLVPATYLDLEEVQRWLSERAAKFLEPEPLRQTRHLLDSHRKAFHTPEELARECLIDIPAIQRSFGLCLENVRRLRQAGVVLGCGTDSGGELAFFGQVHKELKLLVQAGLSRFEALQAATVVNARILGMEEHLGALAPGKLADLIAVQGDPLEDLDCLDRIQWVVKDGKIERSGLANTPIQPLPAQHPTLMNA